jgi:selenocysteine-specific elongation factor
VGSIDVALLVVAADDGWMPQTEEHLQILTYLGVTRAVVALTKSDLVEEPEFAAEVLRESLTGTPFAEAPIVPVSAPKGRGLTELKAALAAVLRHTPAPADIGKPRLPVDRTFSPQGIGTVITGTLTGGAFQRGQEAVIQPSGLKTHLRNLQSHSSNVETALPGMRTAANLADVTIADREDRAGVQRGDIITLESLGPAADTLDVVLEKSTRPVPGSPMATTPLRNGQKLMWHHGGSAREARVYFQGTRTMEPGARVAAQLRFRTPVFAFVGDHFVLRDFARQATIAGGTVLNAEASRALFRKPNSRRCLEACAAAPHDIAVLLASKVQRDGAVPRATALLKSRFSAAEVDAAVTKLVTAKTIIADGAWLLDAGWWSLHLAKCGDVIKAHHKTFPQLTGMDFADLSARAAALLPDKRLLDPFIAALVALGFVRSGRYIRWGAHRASLPPALQSAGAKLRAALAKNLIEPPNPGELAPGPVDRQALKFLLDTSEAIQLDEKAVLLMEAYEKLKNQIVAHLQKSGQATASDLRQITGTTRRILIPLLERLDREGVTRRNGDFRSLKQ